MAKLNVPGGTAKAAKAAAEKVKEKSVLDFVSDEDTAEGFEQITQATMAIPFVRILQSLSPQLNKHEAAYVEEAEEGHWFNTITKEVYGPKISVIVLKFDRVYIEWRPDRGGFVGYHTPENAERLAVDHTFGNWKMADGNSLQENYVYIVLIIGHEREGVAVLSLSSSMIKMARDWNRLMTTHVMDNGKRALPYYLVWDLETEYRSNDKGKWYAAKVRFAGYIDEVQYALTGRERKALPSRQVDYAQIEQRQEGGAREVDEHTEF